MEKVASGFGFLEAPVYDQDNDVLLFADAALGGVWRLSSNGEIDCPYPHRRGIGGMALHAEGGVIVAGRTLAWKRADETYPIASAPAGLTRFNDLTSDESGRVYVGSIDMSVPEPSKRTKGFLHVFDLDGSETTPFDGFLVSNGMKVSPDGTRLYHGDTGASTTWMYDRLADGQLFNKRPLVQWDGEGPDGMAITARGDLVIVLVYGSREQIAIESSEGNELDRIAVPGRATSLCFGGPDLRTLFVVTGSDQSGADRKGEVFAHRMPEPGHPVPLARLRPASIALDQPAGDSGD